MFAVAAILGGVIGESSVRQLGGRIGQVLETDAARVAERLNTEMLARARELTLLAALDPLRTLATTTLPGATSPSPPPSDGLARVRAILAELKRGFPDYVWIGVTDLQNRVVVATDPASVGTDVATRLSPRDIARGRTPGMALARAGGENGEGEVPRLIDLTHPIIGPAGNVTGLIVAQLPWEWIRKLSAPLLTKDTRGDVPGQLFIVSAQNTVLIGPSNTVGQKLVLPIIDRARAGFYGSARADWPPLAGAPAGVFLTGSGFAAGEGQYPGPGSQEMKWTVLIREPLAAAFAPAYELRAIIWQIGALLALAFAAAGWLWAGRITSPLKRIAVAAERLRQGDDVEIPLIGGTEFGSLSGSLRALVATLTRKQVALDEMQDLALHDPLTGLLNRNGMSVHVQRAVTEARAEGAGILVCVGDLDGFKAVNDTLGHAGGDILLRQVAARLAGALRQDDIVARLGGDEFVLALRAPAGFIDTAARAAAERALVAISASYDVSGRAVHIGCSMGGAFWPEHADPRDATLTDPTGLAGVLEKADAALYAVKRTGKGRLLMHGDALAPA